jgi:transcriptional regulator of acetoin/glycerol metabolism
LPLRERIPDLGIFVAHALREQGVAEGAGLTFTLDAALALFTHDWPRNMRELAMAIERARHLAMGGAIERRHLPEWAAVDSRTRLKQELLAELRLTKGNVTEAARRLRRQRTLLYKWLREFEIDPEEFR